MNGEPSRRLNCLSADFSLDDGHSLIQEDFADFPLLSDGLGQPFDTVLVRPRSLEEAAIPSNGVAYTILRRPVELWISD
jgi:hypothetical protein